jgi:hypothetical protein
VAGEADRAGRAAFEKYGEFALHLAAVYGVYRGLEATPDITELRPRRAIIRLPAGCGPVISKQTGKYYRGALMPTMNSLGDIQRKRRLSLSKDMADCVNRDHP